MNTNFVNTIRRIISEQGEAVLANPARLKGFVSDYAKNELPAFRLAFGRCIEAGAYSVLRSAPDRSLAKAALAQKIHDSEGLDMALCNEALDALEAAVFGAVSGRQSRTPPVSQPYPGPSAQYQPPGYQQGQYQNSVLVPQYRQPPSGYPQGQNSPPAPQYQPYQQPSGTGGLWVAVLVCNILGLNWVSRFITGHVGTGILLLLLNIVMVATLAIGLGFALAVVILIIWIVDLVKIGTKKWQMADGTFLVP